jgi:hypothetical protein
MSQLKNILEKIVLFAKEPASILVEMVLKWLIVDIAK